MPRGKTGKKKIVKKTDEIIDTALELLLIRLQSALSNDKKFDEIMEELENSSEKSSDRLAIINNIKTLKLQKISDIISALRVTDDKRSSVMEEDAAAQKIVIELNSGGENFEK